MRVPNRHNGGVSVTHEELRRKTSIISGSSSATILRKVAESFARITGFTADGTDLDGNSLYYVEFYHYLNTRDITFLIYNSDTYDVVQYHRFTLSLTNIKIWFTTNDQNIRIVATG